MSTIYLIYYILNRFEVNNSITKIINTYFCMPICVFMWVLIMFISFSRGLISGLYGGINTHMMYSFVKNSLIIFVLLNRQLSATIAVLLWFVISKFLDFITNFFIKSTYLIWLKVDFAPINPSTLNWLWATTMLILKSVGLFISLPGAPIWVHPYVLIVFLLIKNSSTNIKWNPPSIIPIINFQQKARLIQLSGKTLVGFVLKLLASEVVLLHAQLNQTTFVLVEQHQISCLEHEIFFQ